MFTELPAYRVLAVLCVLCAALDLYIYLELAGRLCGLGPGDAPGEYGYLQA